jgi:gluconolactonase
MIVSSSSLIYELVEESAEVRLVVSGFEFTEGPLWSSEGYLLFSDIPGNVIRRWWEASGKVEEVRRPSNMTNGLTFDAEGRLIACEHATSRVTRTEHDGTITTLASHYGGRELNSPNDVVVKSDGSIYFTDPAYGREAYFGVERPQELDFCGVYKIPPQGGALTLLVDDVEAPNGLCFSPDESHLYVNDSERMDIRVFNLRPDGKLKDGRVLLVEEYSEEMREGNPDGMKVDERGNVYCTGPGGVWVIGREGEHVGTICVPEKTSNLNWGGPGWNTLYITASTSIYRVPMRVCGNRLSYISDLCT